MVGIGVGVSTLQRSGDSNTVAKGGRGFREGLPRVGGVGARARRATAIFPVRLRVGPEGLSVWDRDLLADGQPA